MNIEIKELLSRGVEDIIKKDHLERALQSGKPLRVKFGIDPTGKKIHIGRAVLLWKLRALQDLGHRIVLIVGDFTAQIGDPSDKLEKRPFLSEKQIKENLENYLPQLGKILDLKKIELRYNSEWLAKLDFREISQLAELFTVQQMIERKNFKERWIQHKEISLREFMYPLMQGYDSYIVKADIEIGGTDQLFNLMAGRKIQERYGQEPQDIITCSMLSGLDGRKMSTSWGNVINVIDKPDEQYGKLMSMRDEMIEEYFTLATDIPLVEIKKHIRALKTGENPKIIKEKLARAIVERYHGPKTALKAAEEFRNVFEKKDLPSKMPALKLAGKKIALINVLIKAGVKSKSEARRLVEQGGISFNDAVLDDPSRELKLAAGDILRIGKRKFFRVS